MKYTYKILAILTLLVQYCTPIIAQNAGFTATSKTSGCAPFVVTFAVADSSSGLTHSWDFGNGAGWINNNATSPSRIYSTAGTYTVKHRVVSSAGTNVETKTNYITVHPTPTVAFTANKVTGCPPLQVSFNNTSNPGTTGSATYSWVFGVGATPATGTAKNPTVTYTNGPNNVTLTVVNSQGCEASLQKTAYINTLPVPIVDFSANQTDFCSAPATANFTPNISGAAGPYTYLWEFGAPGNPTSTNANPSYTYTGPAPASYNVKLTATSSNGCQGSVQKGAYIRLHKPNAAFSAPSQACIFTTVNFTNNSTPTNGTHTWFYGDGSNAQQSQNGVHIYNVAGTYTVTLVTSSGGCTDTARRSITILPQPNPVIVTNPDSVCPAPQQVCYSTSPAMASYSWDIQNQGGLNTYTTANPCVMFTKNGCWPSVVRVTDANGCKDTVIHNLTIHELNIITELNDNYVSYPNYVDSGCVQFKASLKVDIETGDNAIHPCFGPDKEYPYGIKSVKWDFGNGATSNVKNPVYIYTDSGHFKITVEVETNNGCIVKDSMRVKVGYKPIIDSISIYDTVICPKTWVNFVGHVRGYDTLVYQWLFGDGNRTTVIDDSTVSHFYQGGPPCLDTHIISLEVSHKGCKSKIYVSNDTSNKSKKFRHVVMLPPCAEFEWEIDTCSKPLTVRFYNRSKGDSSWIWMFGDGDTSTQRNPVHTYATKGYYLTRLIVYNDSSGCYDTMSKSIFFGENKPDVIANKTALCVEDSVKFYAYLTGDTSSATFTWYINNVQVASFGENLTYIFNTPGVYTVTVVSYSARTKCYDTVTKQNWITVGGPTVGFTASPTHICSPGTIQFTDTSKAGPGTTIAKRFWWFGKSGTDTLTTSSTVVSRSYPQRGDYDIYLVITDNIGCTDTAYRPKYVHALKPIADYSVDKTVCVGEEVEFTNNSTNGVKFMWDFGDGGTDTVSMDIKHIYTSRGTYTTKLYVTDSLGCKDTLQNISLDVTKPVADFTLSDSTSVCPPLVVNFNGSISQREITYKWDFDDGGGFGFKAQHTVVYNNIKNYKVKLIVADTNGCQDSIVKDIQVLGYAGVFDYTPSEGCAPLKVDFTSKVKGAIPTVVWDFGDGNTMLGNAQVKNVSYTYTVPGKYLPRMIFNNNQGCNVGSDGLDTIIVDDVTADFDTSPLCQFTTVEFMDRSTTIDAPISSTRWTFHDGAISALSNPKKKYGAAGKYNIKLVVTNQRGCIDSVEEELVINEPIKISALGDTLICLTDSAQLKPTGGVSYEWAPGATLSCTSCNEPYAFPQIKTRYLVMSTDINGCHDTTEVEVDIKTHVESIVGEGGEICEGESISLKAAPANGKDKLTYLWIPGNSVDNPTSAQPTVSPKETTRYMVVAYEGRCIPDSNFAEVIVYPKPTVKVTGGGEIVAGTSADLLASGENIVRFEWSPSATLSCYDCSDPVASPFKTTEYTVVVHTKYDCVDSAKTTVSVLCDESQLFVPNTFTPNGDGMNDVFMVRGAGISTLKSFRVFNRWGEVMFERADANVNDKADGWDGTYNGAQLPPDVYVYMVEAYCENGELLKLKGDITIIR